MHPIDQAKAHFAAFGVRSLEVPEWGELGPDGKPLAGGKPLIIRFTPLTLAEKQQLVNIGQREGYVMRLANALVMKALDAEGKKMFTIDHLYVLRNGVDPDVLSRVVTEMMAATSVEDHVGNSSGTPTST
jgi:hypothetical protein